MESTDKRSTFLKRLINSFRYALTGIKDVIKAERNMKIHLIFTVAVIIAGYLLTISRIEWLFVLIAIGGVISLEMVNSAIERAVDLVTDEYDLLAKRAKDAAAGAVLVFTVIAIIIGIIIFLPKLLSLF